MFKYFNNRIIFNYIKLLSFSAMIIFKNNSHIVFASEDQYFATLKFKKVNMRSGPGIEYPIEWVYTYKNLPIEVIGQFEQWKKIRDIHGSEGWISEKLLYNKTFVIIKNDTVAYKQPHYMINPIMKIDKLVVIKLNYCKEEWCQISYKKHFGWIPKEDLWGVK